MHTHSMRARDGRKFHNHYITLHYMPVTNKIIMSTMNSQFLSPTYIHALHGFKSTESASCPIPVMVWNVIGHHYWNGVCVRFVCKQCMHIQMYTCTHTHTMYRVVGPVMALSHLHGASAEREAHELVSQADAEGRHLLVQKLADHRDRVFAGGGRIAWTVREEDAVGLHRHDRGGGGGGRHDGDVAAGLGEQAQDVALHPVIDGDDLEALADLAAAVAALHRPGRLRPIGSLAARDRRNEVETLHRGEGGGARLQCLAVEPPLRIVGDDGVGHAVVADEGCERPRVDPGDADDAARLQPGVEMARRAPARRVGDGRGDDRAADAGGGGRVEALQVFVVGAGIADMRKGEGDDLAGIRGVGEDFLVAGHCGVETDLAIGGPGLTDAESFEDGAVGQHEEGCRDGLGPRCGRGG